MNHAGKIVSEPFTEVSQHAPSSARLAVDIGGTFTDVVVEFDGRQTSSKVLTTLAAPEKGVMQGVAMVLEAADLAPSDIGILIHGTTLATNALIERKGVKTALIATQGHRDTLEFAFEDRFAEYDVHIDKPIPLVPRDLRFTVPERVIASGRVLQPLDEAAVMALLPELRRHDIKSVAVGFLHSYANPSHEKRVGEILGEHLPELHVTLSSAVCPEVREYERISTATANAYVQPLMASYLAHLAGLLKDAGFTAPMYMMLSGGGLTTLETAIKFPVRMVESGPAGGAILAGFIARQCELGEVLSFDMGGTTAKVCLIDDGQPQSSPSFEVARIYNFLKGSGLPLRIPVVEMIEIGAGGGSIARIDSLRRIAVGPESAGAEPGPACYDRGGREPTVTDADLVLGRIDATDFAGGSVQLDSDCSAAALIEAVGGPLGLTLPKTALGVSEIVDENMANAARIHAVERGKTLSKRTLVAFGGAAPLHAARLADKIGIDQIIIPTSAGVGSAVGFLRAPVSFEVVRSRYMRLSEFDAASANLVLGEMHDEAYAVVHQGAPGAELVETRLAGMRYIGQGHEITVKLPNEQLSQGYSEHLAKSFAAEYVRQFGREVSGADIEIMYWSLVISTPVDPPCRPMEEAEAAVPSATARRSLIDATDGAYHDVPLYARDALKPGMRFAGPAVITEAQTSTIVGPAFDCRINSLGYIVMNRRGVAGSAQ